MLPTSSSTQPASTGGAKSSKSSSSVSGGAIAGIVVGSLAGLCLIAFLVVFFLFRKRRQQPPASVLPVKRDSVFTSTSGYSNYDNTDLEKKWPSELPAPVPSELPADVPYELDSTARVELPTTEKDFRPEPSSSEAGPLPEKMPIVEEEAPESPSSEYPESPRSEQIEPDLVYNDHSPVSSPTVTAVSPTTSNGRGSNFDSAPVSPVSPMFSRVDRHF